MPNYIYTYSTYILIIFLCIFVRHGFNDQHDQPLQKLMQARKLEIAFEGVTLDFEGAERQAKCSSNWEWGLFLANAGQQS